MCNAASAVPQKPEGLGDLEEGVNIQHGESGVYVSREIPVHRNLEWKRIDCYQQAFCEGK